MMFPLGTFKRTPVSIRLIFQTDPMSTVSGTGFTRGAEKNNNE